MRGDFGAISPLPESGAEWLAAYDPESFDLVHRIYSGDFDAHEAMRFDRVILPALHPRHEFAYFDEPQRYATTTAAQRTRPRSSAASVGGAVARTESDDATQPITENEWNAEATFPHSRKVHMVRADEKIVLF